MTDTQNLELNKGDQFIVAVDVSASMGASDTPSGATRIDFSKEKTILIATEATAWDPDGVNILSFGHKVTQVGVATKDNAASLINPLKADQSSTDTAAVIKAGYKIHKDAGHKQTVLFVITDGEPNDEDAVFKSIAAITNEVKDEREFNISFLTVGKRSAGLEAFLTKLDDALPGAKYDIVDVKELEKVDFHEAFAGALND